MIIHSITLSQNHLKVGLNPITITYSAQGIVAGMGKETIALNDGPNVHFGDQEKDPKKIGPREKDFSAETKDYTVDVIIKIEKSAGEAIKHGLLQITCANSIKIANTRTQNFTHD